MPDLTAQANELKQAPDPALQQELQHPTGAVPPYLVMSEVQRRQLTRQAAQSQQNQGKSGSVYDDIVRSMMAKQPPQNLPAAPAGMTPIGNAPSPGGMMGAVPPQNFQAPAARMMAKGGVLHFQDGGLDDEFSDYDPFLDSDSDPFIRSGQQAQGNAPGLGPILGPGGRGAGPLGAQGLASAAEASPDEFMQALGGADADFSGATEASPEEFLNALSMAGLKGGHGGRKGGHGGKRGGGGKGKASGAGGGGGKGGFKISNILKAIGSMAGHAPHGIAAAHPMHLTMPRPIRSHVQGFHFAEGGAHFARGGINSVVDANRVNQDGSTTWLWHDANGKSHTTTTPPGWNLGRGRGRPAGSTGGRSTRALKPEKVVDPGAPRPGVDPDTGLPYKKGAWDHVWHIDPTTGEQVGKDLWVRHKQSAYGNRPISAGYMSVQNAASAIHENFPIVIAGPHGLEPVEDTPEAIDRLSKIGPYGFKELWDRENDRSILVPATQLERDTYATMYDPETNTYQPGLQRRTIPVFPGQTAAPGAAPEMGGAPSATPAVPQVTSGANVGPDWRPPGWGAQPAGAPAGPATAPAAGTPTGPAPAPTTPAADTGGGYLPPEMRPRPRQGLVPASAAAGIRTAKANAGIAREAAIGIFGDPGSPNSPGLIGLADYAKDPNIVKEVGTAFNYLDPLMTKAAGANQMDLSIGPVHIAGGQIGEYLMTRFHVAPELAQALQEQSNQVLGNMSPIARRIFDQTILARDVAMGLRKLYGGISTDSSVAATVRQVPTMGVTAFNPYQMKDPLRGIAGELHNNVQNVKGFVDPDVEELMWNAPGLVENRVTDASITRPQIRQMLRDFGQPDDEHSVNMMAKRAIITYGYRVPDEDPNKPETTTATFRRPRTGSSEFYPGSPEPHLADWFRTNAASNVTGVAKQVGEPGWTPGGDLSAQPTTPAATPGAATPTAPTPTTITPTQPPTPTAQNWLRRLGDAAEGLGRAIHPLDTPGTLLQLPEAIMHPGEALKAAATHQLEQMRQEQQNIKDIRTAPWKVLGRDIGAGITESLPFAGPFNYFTPTFSTMEAERLKRLTQPQPAAPVQPPPQPAPRPPAAVAPAPRPQAAEDEEQVRRRAQEEERRRRAAEQEQERTQPAAPQPAPVPQQAAPSPSEDRWTGPLPWERQQPAAEARGGRIFDRAPTRAETLGALTRK